MSKIYHKIQKYTTDESIRYFYYSKKKDSADELQFLKNKIDSLLKSNLVSDSVKKQLLKLKAIDFNKYNCFYIYSNSLKYAIDDQFVYLFDKKFACLFAGKIPADQIKIIKLITTRGSDLDQIDCDELPAVNESKK